MKLQRIKIGPKLFTSMIVPCLIITCAAGNQVHGQGLSAKPREDLRVVVERAIEPIEHSMVVYRENRRCFSCHHHAHPLIALTEIANRGFAVDRQKLKIHFLRTVGRTKGVTNRYVKHQSIGGGVDTAGYALLAMHAGGHERDTTTAAMVEWILKKDADSSFWSGTHTRPPTQESDLTRTWLCMEAFRHYGTTDQSEQIEQRVSAAREWLLSARVNTTEDKVARLRALQAIGDSDSEIAKFAADLVGDQRDDGGWAQTGDTQSDAYATGSVLMALNQVAGMNPNSDVHQRGVAFLKATQLHDGTWHVKTRAQKVQEYFESGFPHGQDQYISMTATCWAATAVALTFPRVEDSEPVSNLNNGRFEGLSEKSKEEFVARFEHEIWPLVSDSGKSSCLRCHNQKHRSSLRLTGDAGEDFETLFNNGFLTAGDPSTLLHAVSSKSRWTMMPPSSLPRWDEQQIETLRKFVEDLNVAR